MNAAPRLRIALGPSRLAAALIAAGCLATATLIAWLPGAPLLRAALVVVIGAHAVAAMRLWAARTAARAIIEFELEIDHAVRLTERSGRRIEGRVQADSYVGAWLTTLVVLPEGKRLARTVAILPDMLREEEFRRLRVILRLGRDTTLPTER